MCNGVIDCIDGSDEAETLCGPRPGVIIKKPGNRRICSVPGQSSPLIPNIPTNSATEPTQTSVVRPISRDPTPQSSFSRTPAPDLTPQSSFTTPSMIEGNAKFLLGSNIHRQQTIAIKSFEIFGSLNGKPLQVFLSA